MRFRWCLAALAVLAPGVAAAQTRTADGVQALVRGDYATAARILRPLAEDAPEPDPLAQFFMAMMYERGHGVALNQIRACGLYLDAAKPTNPLMPQALALAEQIHENNRFMRNSCFAASENGWSDPPAAVFTLRPDHWVRIDQMGFTVGYKGSQKRAAMTMGGTGWMFLPIRHTRLDVSGPTQTRRHFIEFFVWMPYNVADQPVWGLHWFVHEVVGLETHDVPVEHRLTTIATAQPPAVFPVEDLAVIRVNADGEAEWVVLGAHSRAGVIPRTESR